MQQENGISTPEPDVLDTGLSQVEAETRYADTTVDLVASGICPTCEAARSRVAAESRAQGDA